MKKIATKFWLISILAVAATSTPARILAGEDADCSNSSAKVLNKAAAPYKDAIQQAAKRYDVRPELIKAVMAGRSCFNPVKVSPKGEVGLMQLLPATAVRFGALDITDPAANIDAGTRYLSYLLKRYEDNITTTLAAHSADEGWEGKAETIHSTAQDIHGPVTRTLDILLKLDNRKKANRQTKALLKTWEKSADAYQQALSATPPTAAQKAFAAWHKSRLEKVHYPRTQELRSCGGLSAKTLALKAAPYEDLIKQAAKRHGVNIALIKSVIAAESCYREMVVSPKGASGLMQLMPETAAELGVLDIFDPEENINAGTRYLGWLVRYYGGSFTHAIAAYNAGPGRITPGAPVTIEFAETRGYINTVLTHLTHLEGGKKGLAQAHLLLAGWKQSELEYQAALRGETLAVAPTEAERATPAEAALSMLQAAQQPEVIPATYRTLTTATSTQPMPEALAQVQLIPSAISPDIVRVKRISTTIVTPSTDSTAPQAGIITQPPESPAGEVPELASCATLPASLTAQTQQQGNGRYAAFFYPVQPGETPEAISQKLGANIQDIMRLNNIQANARPKAGTTIRVAECARTADN